LYIKTHNGCNAFLNLAMVVVLLNWTVLLSLGTLKSFYSIFVGKVVGKMSRGFYGHFISLS
jgi:hypothetical protein